MIGLTWLTTLVLALEHAQALIHRHHIAVSTADALNQSAIDLIHRHAGLYRDKEAHPEFAGTVLVTASNSAYTPILNNWRCHAEGLGLDYVVVAMDPGVLVEGRSFLADSKADFPAEERFRRGHFNEMSCLKLKIVQEIIAQTGLNVVFSDPDNVFRDDPFAAGISLGDILRSGAYDYVYQQNHRRHDPPPNTTHLHQEVEEGNTGFYFITGSKRKERGVQALFGAALRECQRNRGLDDQANFWKALRNVRSGAGKGAYGPDSFACSDLCAKGRTCAASDEDVLSYCEMDPRVHATGWDLPKTETKPRVVSYHGNYVSGGVERKIARLRSQGFWDDACAFR